MKTLKECEERMSVKFIIMMVMILLMMEMLMPVFLLLHSSNLATQSRLVYDV